MLYPKIEDCIKKIGCKYTLTIVTAKRSRDLLAKSQASFVDGGAKELTYALREVSDGKLISTVQAIPVVVE